MRNKNTPHTVNSCFYAAGRETASVGHDVGCVRGGKSDGLYAKEFVYRIRFGTQCATSYGLNLHLPIRWREFIPRRYGWLLDAQLAGRLTLSAKKIDNFLCSHASSIAVTMTKMGDES